MNQTRKVLLQLAAMVLVAGAIGGYAWFGVFKTEEAKKKKDDHDLRLFTPQKLDERQGDGGSATADWTHVVVTTPEGTVVLDKTGKDWRLTSPVQTRADKLVIDGLLSQLQTSKFKEALDEKPDAATLAKYGLEPPKFTVEATALVNGETRSVKIVGGAENAFDGSIYVRRDADPTVYTAEGGVRFMLARTEYDLRDKMTFAVDEPKVMKIAVKSANNEFTVEREGNSKQWNVTKPSLEPADAPSVVAMITGAAGERAQRFFPDDAATRQRLGFDHPLADATITLEGGATVRLRAVRQEVDGGEEQWFGLREDADGAVLAELGKGIAQYDRNPADLRDRTVVRFRRELVTKIVFHDPSAGPDVVVQKDAVDASAEAWRVVAPRAGKAKVFKVTGALWTLGAFKALAPGEEKPKDWGKYGLDDKAKSMALFGEDGKELARLTIGKEVIGTPSAYWVRGTRDQVLQSDGSRFGELPFRLVDVLDEPGTDGGVADAAVP